MPLSERVGHGPRRRLVVALALVGSTVAFAACGSRPHGESDVQETTQPLYVLTSQLWQSQPVPICWINDDPSSATENDQRAWVAEEIDKTWSFVSGFSFSGWGHCASASAGVRIRIESVTQGPHTAALGRENSGLSPGLSLDFTFTNWTFTFPDGSNCRDPGAAEVCIRAIAGHEFGHIMGFAHEQNRPDTPALCSAAPQGQNGDATFGEWDLNSIMNYCSPDRKSGALTSIDTEGAQRYYGLGARFLAAISATVAIL
jgi:hypothetical protein